MPCAASISMHKRQQTQPMSNSLVCADRSEPRDLRSDRMHFKNKLRAIILQKYHNAINKHLLDPNLNKNQHYVTHSSSVLISDL